MAVLANYLGNVGTPSTVDSNISAGNLTEGSLFDFEYGNPFGYASDNVYTAFPASGATTAALAVSNGSYISFTLTPDGGIKIDLSSLTFTIARGGSATPRGYAVRSSIDGYAANIATADVATQRTTWTSVNIDLSGAAYQNLTSAVTFRIYFYSPATSNTLDIDTIAFNGTASSAGTDYTQNPADTPSVSDAVGKVIGLNISDTPSLADTIAKAVGVNKADSPAVADAPTPVTAFERTVTEEVDATENTSKAFGGAVSDDLSVSDAESAGAGKSVADGVGVAEDSAKATGMGVDDAPGVADSVAKSTGKAISDSASVAGLLSKAINFLRTIADSISGADSTAKQSAKTIADAPAVADTAALGTGKTVADTASIKDSEAIPVAQWHLNEDSWNGTAGEVIDSVGGNNGTADIGTPDTDPSGMFNRCGLFTGVQGVTIPDDLLDLTADYSVAMWVKINSTSGTNPRAFALVDSINGLNLQVGYRSFDNYPYIREVISSPYLNHYSADSAVPLDTWCHLVWVKEGSNYQIYMDGSPMSMSTGGAPSANTVYSAIGSGGNHSWSLRGRADEVRVYDKALSQDEVTTIYNAGEALSDGTAKDIGKNVNDDPAVSDATAMAAGKGLADLPAVSDSIIKAAGLVQADGALTTDSLGVAIGKLATDQAVATDANSKAIGLGRADDATVQAAAQAGIGHSIDDGVDVGDDAVPVNQLVRLITDGVAATDTLAKSLGLNKADQISAADAAAKLMQKVLDDDIVAEGEVALEFYPGIGGPEAVLSTNRDLIDRLGQKGYAVSVEQKGAQVLGQKGGSVILSVRKQ